MFPVCVKACLTLLKQTHVDVQPSNIKVLGHDALRMRLRRMVETKPSGKCHVDESVRLDYAHHEKREWLEIALLDAIKKWGTDRKQFKKIRVGIAKKTHGLTLGVIEKKTTESHDVNMTLFGYSPWGYI